MLCRDCHLATGCQVIHTDVVTAKCEKCGKEALCVGCMVLHQIDLNAVVERLRKVAKNMPPITMRDLSQEELAAAAQRYPGLPIPLAITRYLLDQFTESGIPAILAKGDGWGGVHLERVGQMVQNLVEAVYHQGKKSITIKLEATDYPETYDHWYLEIKDVQGGEEGNGKV